MTDGASRRSLDPAGALAAGLAVVLLLVQAGAFGRAFDGPASVAVLLGWQLGVVLLTAGGAIARSRRLRISLYVLGALAAVLHGMLTWAFAGALDLLVAAAAGWGAVRALLPELVR